MLSMSSFSLCQNLRHRLHVEFNHGDPPERFVLDLGDVAKLEHCDHGKQRLDRTEGEGQRSSGGLGGSDHLGYLIKRGIFVGIRFGVVDPRLTVHHENPHLSHRTS